ncbi:MAG: SWIM zinc finger family protein [Deinococcales bacterium]
MLHARCSCPVGSGSCKHIAALLYAWVHLPEQFQELLAQELDEQLKHYSKEALIKLVLRMIEAHPELEGYLVTQAPSQQFNPDILQRQVDSAIKQLEYAISNYDRYDHYDRGGYQDAAPGAWQIVEQAKSYLEEPHLSQGQYREATYAHRLDPRSHRR